jgi:hypothetical protein
LITIASSAKPGPVAVAAPSTIAVASVDVEWSKNYRVKNGNIPFCYSVIWLTTPASGPPVSLDEIGFRYLSVYVEDPAETQDLIASADHSLRHVLGTADLIAGHQLCSDLAVLTNAASDQPRAVAQLRAAWRQRREPGPARPSVIDTRYDIGHLLAGGSRLVDVCADLCLDVTQPELRGTSMSALHRRWLQTGDVSAREKISVLNLRHSLSTALAASYAAGLSRRDAGLNVNQMLAVGLGEAFAWTAGPAFTSLLVDRP